MPKSNPQHILNTISPTWRSIRLLGELKILTKASYLSLILVPLLVVVWDGVELTVNKWNSLGDKQVTKFIQLTQEKSSNARIKLDAFNASDVEKIKNINTALLKVEKDLLALERKIEDKDKIPYPLPTLWIRVFFCAIFVGLAHLVYQIWCPEEIQEHSLESFANDKKSLFTKFGTISDLNKAEIKLNSNYDHANNNIKKEAKGRVDKIKPLKVQAKKEYISKLDFSELYNIKKYILRINQPTEAELKILDIINPHLNKMKVEDIDLVNLNTIGEAAELDYKQMASKTNVFIYLSGFLYLVGIFLLILIIIAQVKNVVCAGNFDWYEYFNPNLTVESN